MPISRMLSAVWTAAEAPVAAGPVAQAAGVGDIRGSFRLPGAARDSGADSDWAGVVPDMRVPGGALPIDDAEGAPARHVRSIFVSDVHLGTPGCQAGALLSFLKAHSSDQLYLVGDIIDGWQLRRRWFWPQSHNDVVQKILRRVRKGCRVVFVPGNHDEFVRHFVGHHFGGVEVVPEAIHITATGKRLWVTHGDLYDGVIQYAKWLAYVGDSLYEFTLRLNRHFNSLRARLGLPYWSLSQYLKHRVKKAVGFVTRFEEALAAEARKRGADGVVCGHIHARKCVTSTACCIATMAIGSKA